MTNVSQPQTAQMTKEIVQKHEIAETETDTEMK